MDKDTPPIAFEQLPAKAGLMLPSGDPTVTRLLEEYCPWRKVRYAAPEQGLDPLRAWATIKAARRANWKETGLPRWEGGSFGLCIGPHLMEPLHRIDRATGGGAAGGAGGVLVDADQYDRLRLRTLMDEAAESSIIEGAATTRKEAVDLLRSGREPVKTGERMVANNYAAMQQVKEWLDRPLTVAMLLELQAILTRGTLEDPTAAGRLRRPDEQVRVVDARDDSVVFVPPPALGLQERLERVCAFANREHSASAFLHPIVKACILHFMLGYEHPFVDGNGRTARAAFYWCALRAGYGVFEFLSISEIIRKGFARYPQAYLDTEIDDGDLTYFVLYKLDVIEQALDQLAAHLKREAERITQSARMLKVARGLNLRQRLLLEHALRHPGTMYTVKGHMNSNRITANTARADLEGLVRRKLAAASKRGKEAVYHVTGELAERMARREE